MSVLSAARAVVDYFDESEGLDIDLGSKRQMDFIAALEALQAEVNAMEGFDEPVAHMLALPLDDVQANNWNPNRVAPRELRLLYTSISADGYTQPTVVTWDDGLKKYVIVDGFHRWLTMKRHPDIAERTGNRLPCVVLNKSIEERMASTIRHNRARGKHSVAGMSGVVFGMLDKGMSDEEVCGELGMEAEELIRLKHITGFARLFENVDYARAWETRRQIRLRKEYADAQAATAP